MSLKNRFLWGINNGLYYVAKETVHQGEELASSKESKEQPPSRVVGVSMWMPPQPVSEQESWYAYFQSCVLSFRQLMANIQFLGRGGLLLNRYKIWKKAQLDAQHKFWKDDSGYYFCNVVAVLPGQQGKGIGRKLFEAVTKKADAEGVKCYLESSKKEPNVKIYERMGFKLVGDLDCDDNGTVCKVGLSLPFLDLPASRCMP